MAAKTTLPSTIPLTPLGLSRLIPRSNYQAPHHIRYLQRRVLTSLARPGRAGIVVELPVRHGKSRFCSWLLPTWYHLSFPDHSVILTGYGDDFAGSFGEDVRNTVNQVGWALAGLRVREDHSKRHDWRLHGRKGGMRAVGTGGQITGHGCHLLICDDPIKSQEDADSPTKRDALWKWWMADAYSRLEPDGKCVVVLSRRHRDDLTGRLLAAQEAGGDSWEVVRLPALAEPDDPLGRPEGEALWPGRYSRTQLAALRTQYEVAGMNHLWECLYAQNPLGDPASREWPDDYFESIWIDDFPAAPLLRVLACDPSKGARSRSGDYCAIADVRYYANGLLVVNALLVRIPTTDIEDTLVSWAGRAIAEGVPYAGVIIEANGFQEVLADNVQLKMGQGGLPTPVYRCVNTKSKDVRIRESLTPLLHQRRLKLLKSGNYNRLLFNQLRDFPNGDHDDGPDAVELGTQLLNHLLAGSQTSNLRLVA